MTYPSIRFAFLLFLANLNIFVAFASSYITMCWFFGICIIVRITTSQKIICAVVITAAAHRIFSNLFVRIQVVDHFVSSNPFSTSVFFLSFS